MKTTSLGLCWDMRLCTHCGKCLYLLQIVQIQSWIPFSICSHLFTQPEFDSVNMTTPHANLDVTDVKEWSFRARSLLAARIAVSYLMESESTNNRLIIKRQDVHDTIQPKIEIAQTVAAESEVDLARPVVPNVTYLEMIYFFIWSIMVVMTQAWRDFVERRPFQPTLATNSAVHYYVSLSGPNLEALD